MKSATANGAGVGEIHVPKEIIQCMQSFMTGKEAARTTLISKYWKSSWETRPIIILDERDFDNREQFLQFGNKTIDRYQDLKLRVETLRIFMKDGYVCNEVMVKAMNLEASNLYLETGNSMFLLPIKVLESKKLVRASLIGCRINESACLSNLNYIRLCKVWIEGDAISDTLSTSTLLQKLEMSDCRFCVKIKSSDRWSGDTVPLKYGASNVGIFHRLKFLILEKLEICYSFFSGFSSKFPCMKMLTICNCFGPSETIEIESPSLEEICIKRIFVLRAEFDVPTLRKFTYIGGRKVPSLTFERASRNLEFEIGFEMKSFQLRQFIEVNSLLKILRKYESNVISLSLVLLKVEKCDVYPIGVHPIPVVESLKIGVGSWSSPAVMVALFRAVRPKCIYQIWLTDATCQQNYEFLVLLCNTLIQVGKKELCIPNRELRGLARVEVEMKEGCQFKPVDWKIIFDADIAGHGSVFSESQIRFKLQWE